MNSGRCFSVSDSVMWSDADRDDPEWHYGSQSDEWALWDNVFRSGVWSFAHELSWGFFCTKARWKWHSLKTYNHAFIEEMILLVVIIVHNMNRTPRETLYAQTFWLGTQFTISSSSMCQIKVLYYVVLVVVIVMWSLSRGDHRSCLHCDAIGWWPWSS